MIEGPLGPPLALSAALAIPAQRLAVLASPAGELALLRFLGTTCVEWLRLLH
jgi:hypothetical protein